MNGLQVHEAVHRYMDALYDAGVPQGTIRARRTVLYRLARSFHGRNYKGITRKDLADFLYGKGGILSGVTTASTRSVYRASLRHFFAYGEDMGWGKAVEVPKPVITPRGDVQRRQSPPTRLSEVLLVQLLESCDETDAGRVLRGMLAVAVNTAWRVSDIQQLQIRQVDMVGLSLNFVSQKTSTRDSFPMSLDLEEEINRYMSWYCQAANVTWRDGDAYMFPAWNRHGLGYKKGFLYTPNPRQHVSYSWALSRLQEHLALCGVQVERHEAWHVVRRSVARIYFDSLRNDISYAHALKQTAALLQHRSTSTTEDYLGLSTELQARDDSLRGKRFIGVRKDTSVISFNRARERRAGM